LPYASTSALPTPVDLSFLSGFSLGARRRTQRGGDRHPRLPVTSNSLLNNCGLITSNGINATLASRGQRARPPSFCGAHVDRQRRWAGNARRLLCSSQEPVIGGCRRRGSRRSRPSCGVDLRRSGLARTQALSGRMSCPRSRCQRRKGDPQHAYQPRHAGHGDARSGARSRGGDRDRP
jgi:hypothetical protein